MNTFYRRVDHFSKTSKMAILTSDLQLTYRDLKERVLLGAEYLSQHGVTSNSIVGMTVRDEVEHLVASLSLLLLSAKKITLASYESSKMHTDLCIRSGVNQILTLDEVCSETHIPSLLWRPNAQANMINQVEPSDMGHIFLRTSGTTGKPNILDFNQQQLGLQSERHPEYGNEVLLRLASIEHNNSIRHRLYCVYQGGTNAFFDKNKDPNLLDFIQKQNVTCLDVSRMHLDSLLNSNDREKLKSVKVRTGGSSVPFSIRKAFEKSVSENLYIRYATSETGAISMAVPGEHDEDACSGKPLKGVQVKIINSKGEQVSNCEPGQIGLVVPGMVKGYLNNAAQTSERFIDGWFYPGDIGFIRNDGCLVVLGRSDDTIIMNGLNIFPKEIEDILELHPDVLYAAAIGIESRIHGNIPVAVVELNSDTKLTPQELVSWAKKFLGLKSPKKIIFVPHIPRNSQGKILRKDIHLLFKK